MKDNDSIETTEQNPAAEPADTTAAPPAKKGGKGLAVFALLLALAAIGGSGYLWYLWFQEQERIQTEQAALDARIDERLQQRVEPELAQRDETIDNLQSRAQELQSAATNLKSETGSLQSTMQTLQTDISSLQGDIRTLQGGIQTLKNAVDIEKGSIEIQKNDTLALQKDIQNLQKDITHLQGEIQAVRTAAETQAGDAEVRQAAVQSMQDEVQTLQSNLQTLQEQLAAQDNARQDALAEIRAQLEDINLRERNLLTTLKNVKEVAALGGDVNALPLSEVEYLLRMADHKLQLQRDTNGALTALETARRRLRGVDETQFQPILNMLDDNIASLRGVNLPDRSALAHKIVEMEQRVDDLPLRNDVQIANLKNQVKPQPLAEDSIAAQSEQSWITQFQSAAWQQIKDIIVIRNERSSGPPLIAVEEEYFLIQNLRLELEAMRLALLSNDPTNFQDSSELATNWLQTYFDSDATAVKEMLAELQALQTIQFNPYIPDISGTLRAFRDVMERREPVRSTTTPLPSPAEPPAAEPAATEETQS